MTALETVKHWLAAYPGYDILGNFFVDYTDQIPNNGGIFPAGLVEVRRTEDILGNVQVENQYNFGLYYVFCKGDGSGAEENADWLMDFQTWVQEQAITGACPQFGDKTTAIQAQNGALYAVDPGGTATYMVQLSIRFQKKFEVNP